MEGLQLLCINISSAAAPQICAAAPSFLMPAIAHSSLRRHPFLEHLHTTQGAWHLHPRCIGKACSCALSLRGQETCSVHWCHSRHACPYMVKLAHLVRRRHAPMMVPFQDRARVFQAVVASDRAAARGMDALGAGVGHKFVTIRRSSLLEVCAAWQREKCIAGSVASVQWNRRAQGACSAWHRMSFRPTKFGMMPARRAVTCVP